jgi:hypothetical protein
VKFSTRHATDFYPNRPASTHIITRVRRVSTKHTKLKKTHLIFYLFSELFAKYSASARASTRVSRSTGPSGRATRAFDPDHAAARNLCVQVRAASEGVAEAVGALRLPPQCYPSLRATRTRPDRCPAIHFCSSARALGVCFLCRRETRPDLSA